MSVAKCRPLLEILALALLCGRNIVSRGSSSFRFESHSPPEHVSESAKKKMTMSQSITVRTHTVRSTSSVLVINLGYLKTWSGILKALELALGIVCVSIAASALDNTPGLQFLSTSNDNIFTLYKAHIFFLLITVTFMIGTFILLLSCLVSFYTSTGIAKTVYEIIYHAIAFGLYITASITYFIPVLEVHRNHRGNYSHLMAAAIIGLVNSALYLLSTIMARRLYR